MELVRLSEIPCNWDELIGAYSTKTLFHGTPWLRHVQSIHPKGHVEVYRIANGRTTAGYFCGLRIRKFGVSILGSPLGGTGTNYMGPIVNAEEIDQEGFVAALVRMCKQTAVRHVEVSNEWLDPRVMQTFGFTVHDQLTHVCALPAEEDTAWRSLTSTCRNRIRKAERNGLRVEATDDPSLADEYFPQFTEVYAKQGMAVPYGKERPRSLLAQLGPADQILALRVKHKDTVIATGLFPHDQRCVYFWGGASWLEYQHLCPNELLHWTVIKYAVRKGISSYDMCGGSSRFKNKFGGSDIPHHIYSRSFIQLLAKARTLYRSLHFARLRVVGYFRRTGVPRRPRVG